MYTAENVQSSLFLVTSSMCRQVSVLGNLHSWAWTTTGLQVLQLCLKHVYPVLPKKAQSGTQTTVPLWVHSASIKPWSDQKKQGSHLGWGTLSATKISKEGDMQRYPMLHNSSGKKSKSSGIFKTKEVLFELWAFMCMLTSSDILKQNSGARTYRLRLWTANQNIT